ncbi:hypothetical protein [Salimicrobium album]|uniref:Uncharacterized protein n=1 Tax=Salimicrobium album TaxID=50717 RepID=A0A1H3D6E5_9BACI|nr:hypothetical protein [Salimicrobium album]SDX61981.1 hypothetical protein SAMN04488081_0848 [Salimicrobium album]
MYERITPDDYKQAAENGVSRPTLERRVWSYHWPKQKAITERKRTYGKKNLTNRDLRKKVAIDELHAFGVSATMAEELEQLELRVALARFEGIDVEADAQKWF